MMPLYNKGVRRKSILKIALTLNDWLSRERNASILPEKQLPDGYLLSPEETKNSFPQVDDYGLKGSAVWYDGMIIEPERLVMEILGWSCDMGTEPLNYIHVTDLITADNKVEGVRGIDKESDTKIEFQAPIVINAAGPWNREISVKFDKDHPHLFEKYLLLWNILFKKESISKFSLAVSPGKGSGHTYFIHDWKGRLLIGTGEEVIPGSDIKGYPTLEQIEKTLRDIHTAIPSLSLQQQDIDHVYRGVLPADKNGLLTKREVIINHQENNGPQGLYSISGIKFTTSRRVAEKTLDLIFPDKKDEARQNASRSTPRIHVKRGVFDFDCIPDPDNTKWLEELRLIIREESVIHLDDFIFRRTNLGENKERLLKIINQIRSLFSWDDPRWKSEVDRIFQSN
jgi:glycerol-3-phosphate dehydrogenase